MAQQPIVRLGDTSSHGGFIITVYSVSTVDNNLKMARVTDLHFCPRRGHGITPIVNGSGNFRAEGKIVAVRGSVCGCGAIMTMGSSDSYAPLEAPRGAFIVSSDQLNRGIWLG